MALHANYTWKKKCKNKKNPKTSNQGEERTKLNKEFKYLMHTGKSHLIFQNKHTSLYSYGSTDWSCPSELTSHSVVRAKGTGN